MANPTDPRPQLSTENLDNLNRALRLVTELQGTVADPDGKLTELKSLLNRCRDGIRRQNPAYRRQRLQAVDKARNYLHFLRDMGQDDAQGRLRSVSRRLSTAARA